MLTPAINAVQNQSCNPMNKEPTLVKNNTATKSTHTQISNFSCILHPPSCT